MPPSFSTPAAAAALFLALLVSDVANSNTGRILVQAVPDFRFVGNGACISPSPYRLYDYIAFQNGANGAVVTSKDDCVRLCVPCACEVSVRNTNRQFRGFVHSPTTSTCYCYFDDDRSANFSNECENIDAGKGFSESPFKYLSGRAGDGEILASNNNPLSDCWAIVTIFDTSDDCPSDAPSESPSDAPSESPSDAPSESPSDAPSESPSDAPSESPSDAPSESPSDAPSESPSDAPVTAPSESPSDAPSESSSPTAKASKKSKGPKSSKMPKASSLQTQAMKSGGSPSLSLLTIVGVCGVFAVITFMFVDVI